jgi:hypothetical protein
MVIINHPSKMKTNGIAATHRRAMPASMFRQMKQLENKGEISGCVAICEEGMRRVPIADFKNYCQFRIQLVRYLVNAPEPQSPSDEERAIRVLRDLEKRIPQSNRETRRNCKLFLVHLFRERRKGNKQNNLKEAKRYIQSALIGLSKQKEPEKWAVLKSALAEIYANPKISKGKESLDKAIQLTTDALTVYTAIRFPEDHRIYSLALEALKMRRAQ